jgi:hypothetical protein
MSGTVTADELLLEAHGGIYRFPDAFSGFRAGLVFEGDTVAAGSVVVWADGGFELRIELGDAELAWLDREFASLVGHRVARTYEDGDGRFEKELDPVPSPLGALVRMRDELGSSYRVRQGRITLITRVIGGRRFSIVPQRWERAPDGRVVTTEFTVCYWEGEPASIERCEVYTDAYADVGGLFLPSLRRVVTASAGGVRVRQLELDAHELIGAGR